MAADWRTRHGSTDTLGRLVHFGPENNALQGEIIALNFLFGSHLHCCSNNLGFVTE
jgi:hypothetical protein